MTMLTHMRKSVSGLSGYFDYEFDVLLLVLKGNLSLLYSIFLTGW